MITDIFNPELLLANFNEYVYVILMMLGLWAMISKNNLVKKLLGMSIFQTSIILFYVSIGAKRGATIPILEHHGGHGDAHHAIDVMAYANPLPHVLMLTAIVVGVATLGLALAIVLKLSQEYKSVEEDEIMEKID